MAVPTDIALLGAALLVAHAAGFLAGRRQRVSIANHLHDMLLWGLVAARLGFVVIWFEQYRSQPWSMLDLRDGGFSLWSGLGGALLLAAWRGWQHPALRRPLAFALLAGALSLGAGQAWQAGHEAPALSTQALSTLPGTPTTLAALAEGRPMVVNLWASWCPPCRREMPLLHAAQQRGDVRFVFVNQGEAAAAVQQYLQAEGLQLDNVLLDPASALGREYKSVALPTTLFFDARGRLAATHLGELSAASLASKLQMLRTTPLSKGNPP
ncbi:TlpA disulfide reductase family protein [Jeongeupia wiesaeckerbachi]|uniref:TlpA family protein disulfide reductase n=1 Tax=Jeongeupia wiesaeckerbachi TaxID=3051218 RepID=UPI003D8085A0